MTGQGMVNKWLILSGKPDTSRTSVLEFLNTAKDEGIPKLHKHYAHDLQSEDTLTQDSDGKVDVTSLSPRSWEDHNGIVFVRPQNSTTIHYTRISEHEWRKMIQAGMGDFTDPMIPKYRIFGDYMYCIPKNNGQVIDVFYIKTPTTILDDASTALEFTDRIHNYFIWLALEGVVKGAAEKAEKLLKDINVTIPKTESNRFVFNELNTLPQDGGFIYSNPLGDTETIQGVLSAGGGVWQGGL